MSLQSRQGHSAPPYSTFAGLYDALMGNSMFPLLRRNFHSLVNRYRIGFRSLADVACGTGAFLRLISPRLTEAFGIDRSPSMLRIAARKNRGRRVRFLKQDLRDLDLPHPVDLITCHFDSLNYLLSLKDLARTFRRFSVNLKKGGHLIFDMVTEFVREPQMGIGQQVFQLPGIVSVWNIAWNPDRQLRVVTMHHFAVGREASRSYQREVHVQRPYPIATVIRLLAGAGFKLRGVHDAGTLSPASSCSYRAVYVAQRLR